MYRLIVLAALFAVAAARPGLVAETAPAVYAAPAVAVHEPVLAKVGAIVKSIPTAVSHQSQSIVHSSAHVVEPIVAPVVKSTTYAAAAPVVAAAPLYKTVAAAPVAYTAPAAVVRSAYAAPFTYAAAPFTYAATPLTYASAPLSYAATYSSPLHYTAW